MKQMKIVAAAVLLSAGLAGAGAASASMSEASKHKAHVHDKLAAKHAKNPDAKNPNGKAPRVSEASARRIAWRSGVDHIEEIVLSGERWEIAGRDRTGQEKALDIHADDGSVIN